MKDMPRRYFLVEKSLIYKGKVQTPQTFISEYDNKEDIQFQNLLKMEGFFTEVKESQVKKSDAPIWIEPLTDTEEAERVKKLRSKAEDK